MEKQEVVLYRKLLVITGITYLIWWFAVKWLLPEAFNPIVSRIIVVGIIGLVWLLSYAHSWIEQNLRLLFTICAWLITLHFYYLFYFNASDPNWIIGAYITVTAIGFFLLSNRSLILYSIFVLALSIALVVFVPDLRTSVFLPGLLTILIQAVLGSRSRFALIKERETASALAQNIKMRDEFISLASHELKTPISILKMQTQLMERDLKSDEVREYSPEKIEGFVSTFTRQIDRLIELVETMLDASRISSEKIVLSRQDVDLTLLTRDILTGLLSRDVRTGLGIEGLPTIELEAPGALVISGDYNRLRQVVEKVLSNAIKYGEGKPVAVKLAEEDGQAVLQVVDQGFGIAPQHLERIFQRFERAISGRNISGLGLGLYIARQNVNAHGGNITVESQAGEGSTFTIRLPKSGMP